MRSFALETFVKYMGTGLMLIWFLLALLYLFVYEKRKPRRILFVYAPLVTLLLFFNPLFSRLLGALMGEEVYFRTCWILPVIMEIAYCVAEIAGRLKGRRGAAFVAAAFFTVMVSGKLVYVNPLYSLAENSYHVPDSVVHICDAIRVPGREVMAAFPLELTPYVRQYSPPTCMPYGREMVMKSWGHDNALCDAMEREVIDMEELVPLARQAGCHYVIFPTGQEVTASPESYGWIPFQETDGYVIYRDPEVELVIPANLTRRP